MLFCHREISYRKIANGLPKNETHPPVAGTGNDGMPGIRASEDIA